jgi:hypothetical protein
VLDDGDEERPPVGEEAVDVRLGDPRALGDIDRGGPKWPRAAKAPMVVELPQHAAGAQRRQRAEVADAERDGAPG